jgi:hypothetical protein
MPFQITSENFFFRAEILKMPRRDMLLHLLVESPIDPKVVWLDECKKNDIKDENSKTVGCDYLRMGRGVRR